MAKGRGKAKRAANVKPKATPEVTEAWVKLYAETFFVLMMGMVKAEPHEEAYAKFADATRALTKEQLRRSARYAGEYFVSEANPDVRQLPKDETQPLTVRAMEYALGRLADEEKK
jgi:hypothetical protein